MAGRHFRNLLVVAIPGALCGGIVTAWPESPLAWSLAFGVAVAVFRFGWESSIDEPS